VGHQSFVFILLLFVSFQAHARKPTLLTRVAQVLGCGSLLSSSPLNLEVDSFAKAFPQTVKVSPDKEEPGTFHVHARIYNKRQFPNREGLPADATDEFNFVVDEGYVRVTTLESIISNKAFRLVQHFRHDHFPYATVTNSEAYFSVKYFAVFIAEIEKLGFAVY
jgi:hypothetical protein